MRDEGAFYVLAVIALTILFGSYFTCVHRHETSYAYEIQYTTCLGETRDTTVTGWKKGIKIENYRVAVPELWVLGTRDHDAFRVALNVCDFRIISKTQINEN